MVNATSGSLAALWREIGFSPPSANSYNSPMRNAFASGHRSVRLERPQFRTLIALSLQVISGYY